LENVPIQIEKKVIPLKDLGQVIAKDGQNLMVIPNDMEV
jgi:ribosome recycling factor